jgi:transposase InsO family protein
MTAEEVKREKQRIRKRVKNYFIHGGMVWRLPNMKHPTARKVPTVEERIRLLESFHNMGHGGVNKTLSMLQARYYWPAMTYDCRRYIRACVSCQEERAKFANRPALHPLPIVNALERVHMDLCGPLPRSTHGNEYLVVCCDSFSKWVEAAAIPNKQAKTIAKFFLERIIAQHGCPVVLQTDQGTEFQGDLQTLLKEFHIEHVVSSAYRPTSNGLVERMNQTLQQSLLKMVNDEKERWEDELPRVLLGYRAARHCSTGYSPFYMMYNRNPTLPEDLRLRQEVMRAESQFPEPGLTLPALPAPPALLAPPAAAAAGSPRKRARSQEPAAYVQEQGAKRLRLIDEARKNLVKAQQRMVKDYDRRQGGADMIPEHNYVWVKLRRVNKLGKRVKGPFYLWEYSADKTKAVLLGKEGKAFTEQSERLALCTLGELEELGEQLESDKVGPGRP